MLDIDPVTITAQIINFLVLAIILYFFFFKPTFRRIEKRAEENKTILAKANLEEEIANRKLTEIEERLSGIDNEIEARLEEAYQHAQGESDELLKATQLEAENILQDAEREAAKRQMKEMDELQDRLVDTIIGISAKILAKTSPDEVHDNQIKELTTEIWDLGRSDIRQVRTIRDSMSERTPTVFISSAKELTADQQREIIRTFSALADQNVNMEVEIKPELISGIQVRMGDFIVENTFASELESLKSEVIESLENGMNVEE